MQTTDALLRNAIAKALKRAQQQGDLPVFDLPEIPVERPKQAEMGDWATPVCLQLARVARMAPIKIATALAAHLPKLDFIGSAQVAPPGFINFTLDEGWLRAQVDAILAAGQQYGVAEVGGGQRMQVEYVSANPTGPLHMGSARNAVLGDALANVLANAGYAVQREYYVNDAGSRMRAFQESLLARYRQALGQEVELPEDGYRGAYMVELGAELARTYGAALLDKPLAEALLEIGRLGVASVVANVRGDLLTMGISYDCWFSEQSLYDNGQFDTIMSLLRQGGHLDVHDGAVWFQAVALGGQKDEVILRSDGTPGYFASDIAYHYNKFIERGYDRVIDVWGADHQGHVPRMKHMMHALGLDPKRLEIIIYQLVTLKRGGEIVRLSKRTGDIITLREVLDEVGPDAMRYFLLSRSADSQMEFDIDLAKEQSDENPVYYIQYAHARICSILRHAGALDYAQGEVALLAHPAELALIRQMLRLPDVVRLAAEQLAPHHLAYYAYDLAAAFHGFYRDCRVVSAEADEQHLTLARLKLVAAARLVLARVLGIMGMSAPEVM